MIRISDVQKYFDDYHALRDINLEIQRGEVVVVLGPSGSGKSTLCRTINRLETIESGSIAIDGTPLPEEGKALATLRADVGMVFQQFNLFPHLTIKDNVTLGPIKVRKMSKSAANDLALQPRPRGDCQPGRQIPGAALRWPATARRHRPRARDEAEGHALR